MPKVSRKMDPVVGEAAVMTNHGRSSNSSSPLVPPLSIHMSPVHTEESNEVAEINSPCSSVFPLSMPVSHLIDPDLMSPESHLSNCKVSGGSSTRKRKASTDCSLSDDSIADSREKEDKESVDTSDNGFSSMHDSSEDSLLEKESDQRVKETVVGEGHKSRAESLAGKSRAVVDALTTDGDENSSEARPEGAAACGKETDRPAPCSALAGYVALAGRSGETVLRGAMPSTPGPHQGGQAALNTCFPASDGNWYQIISAPIPSVFSCQPATETSSNTSTPTSTTPSSSGLVPSNTRFSSLGFMSSLPLVATASATTTTTHSSLATPVPTPGTATDPLLALLQQYSAGSACGPDLHASLPALHLPLNLATAAATAAATGHSTPSPTPRYLYATNPRTGQLLILSTVGDVAGGHTLQHLQQQSSLQQMIQLQQQQLQLKSQVKAEWKSPLGLNQQQNCQPPASTGTTAKSTAKPGSVVSQLLHSKRSAILNQSENHDENTPSVVAAHELLALASPTRTQRPLGQSALPLPLFHSSPTTDSKCGDEPVRENHNMKERRRRARIKDACDLMRQLVPGMSEKTDKATVFEFSARYIHFLKNFVGTHHDKDFLIKYSPY